MHLITFTVQLFLYIFIYKVKIVTTSLDDANDRRLHDNIISIIHQWAPKVWLEPNEEFFPSSVIDFLREVTIKEICGRNCTFTEHDLPIGVESARYALVTKGDKDQLLNNHSSILYGTNPAMKDVPVYVHVSACDPSYSRFIITYWFFYPYNEGKELCTVNVGRSGPYLPVPRLFKRCVSGRTKLFGNHVGDWEHMTLEIVDSMPRLLYLSVHSVGLWYQFNIALNAFLIHGAKRDLVSQVLDPPEMVHLQDGHPVLFAARGSHALWASAGVHQFTKVRSAQLVDEVGYGQIWKTWRDLRFLSTNRSSSRWFFYEGLWGNPKTGCLELGNVASVCESSSGPRGLSKRKLQLTCMTH